MSRAPSWNETPNPFSTRCVRPGAIPFLFPPSQSAEPLIARLQQNGWIGAIIGPHGSGKSTLLATLAAAISDLPRRLLRVDLHDGQRQIPVEARRLLRRCPPELLVIDGYEQMGRWNRARLVARCRRGGWGLLATAHAPVGLPEIHRMGVDHRTVVRLVDNLQKDYPAHISSGDVLAGLERHGTNIRELLFELYDLYESRRRDTPSGK